MHLLEGIALQPLTEPPLSLIADFARGTLARSDGVLHALLARIWAPGGLYMEPPMVDERMRAAWGRRFTQKDTADYIERSAQMLAKMGNPDSSDVNADKVEQPGTAQMSSELAHPEELATPPVDTRAGIEEHVRRLAPPAEFLQRGKELIGTQGRGGLRMPGQRSFCKRSWARASVVWVLRVHGGGWKRTETRAR